MGIGELCSVVSRRRWLFRVNILSTSSQDEKWLDDSVRNVLETTVDGEALRAVKFIVNDLCAVVDQTINKPSAKVNLL